MTQGEKMSRHRSLYSRLGWACQFIYYCGTCSIVTYDFFQYISSVICSFETNIFVKSSFVTGSFVTCSFFTCPFFPHSQIHNTSYTFCCNDLKKVSFKKKKILLYRGFNQYQRICTWLNTLYVQLHFLPNELKSFK